MVEDNAIYLPINICTARRKKERKQEKSLFDYELVESSLAWMACRYY